MSADLKIEATIITQSGTDLTPRGVTVKGTGNMSHSAVREVAVEALDSFTGTYEGGYMVDRYPSFHEKAEDTVTMFPVVKVGK